MATIHTRYARAEWDHRYTYSECLTAARAFEHDAYRFADAEDRWPDAAFYAEWCAKNADYWYKRARDAQSNHINGTARHYSRNHIRHAPVLIQEVR